MRHSWIFAVAFGAASGCSPAPEPPGNVGEMQTIDIAAHRAPCMGITEQLCLVVKKSGASNLGFEYGQIEGLIPKWGHQYTVDIEVVPVPNPPADGSSLRSVLRSLRRDEVVAAGTIFKFRVFSEGGANPARFVSLTGPDGGQLMDGTPFRCSVDSGSCSQISIRLARQETFDIVFQHGGDSLVALRAEDAPTRGPAAQ
jgi:hypothetical protein